MSNFWKKQGQHDGDLRYEHKHIIGPSTRDLPFIQEYCLYKGQITPNTMIKDHQAYSITYLHPLLIINGIMISLENGKVKYVNIFGIHPNQDPNSGQFCLPEYKLNIEFTEDYFNNLIKTIKTYYLDNSFTIPPLKYVTYKKLKSIYTQLNQGDD